MTPLADFERGLVDGYRLGWDECDQAWHLALNPAAEAARYAAGHPDFAELERRRWGPGGREHFGDPRPGDYPGKRGAA